MAFVLSLIAAAALASAAPDPASPEAVRVLAGRACGSCHAVGSRGKSAYGQAPPFREVVRRKSADDIRQALADGFFVAHPVMPKFVLKPAEIEGLVAYLDTLRR